MLKSVPESVSGSLLDTLRYTSRTVERLEFEIEEDEKRLGERKAACARAQQARDEILAFLKSVDVERDWLKEAGIASIATPPPPQPPSTKEEYLERMEGGWNGFTNAVDARAAKRRQDAERDAQKDAAQREARKTPDDGA